MRHSLFGLIAVIGLLSASGPVARADDAAPAAVAVLDAGSSAVDAGAAVNLAPMAVLLPATSNDPIAQIPDLNPLEGLSAVDSAAKNMKDGNWWIGVSQLLTVLVVFLHWFATKSKSPWITWAATPLGGTLLIIVFTASGGFVHALSVSPKAGMTTKDFIAIGASMLVSSFLTYIPTYFKLLKPMTAAANTQPSAPLSTT